MSNANATTEKIIKRGGYVVGVRCGKGHSGNDHIGGPTNRYYSCSGCHGFFTPAQILERLAHPGGEKGNGGLYTVAE